MESMFRHEGVDVIVWSNKFQRFTCVGEGRGFGWVRHAEDIQEVDQASGISGTSRKETGVRQEGKHIL